MMQKIGYDVKKLRRVAIGQLTLAAYKKANTRFLTRGCLSRIFRKRKSEADKLKDAKVADKKPIRPGKKSFFRKKKTSKNSNRRDLSASFLSLAEWPEHSLGAGNSSPVAGFLSLGRSENFWNTDDIVRRTLFVVRAYSCQNPWTGH